MTDTTKEYKKLQYNKLPSEKLNDELMLLKKHLPNHRHALAHLTNIGTIYPKLKNWVKEGKIFQQERVIEGRRFIYFTESPETLVKIESPWQKQKAEKKVDKDAPTDKWFETNGTSTIYKPTLNINYGKQMSLYRKSSERVSVSGSSLSNFV